MITAKLVKVGSEEDLETGKANFRLGFRLPTGDIVYADATPEVMVTLRKYEEKNSHAVPAPQPPPMVESVEDEGDDYVPDEPPEHLEPAPSVDEYDQEEADEEVRWREVPEQLLPEHVKAAMGAMRMGDQGLPEVLTVSQLVQIRDSILDEYTPQDWKQLGYAEEEQVRAVKWESGVTSNPKFVPQRRVRQVDERGNPVVRPNPNDVDPGEIAATDDEDGVDQF